MSSFFTFLSRRIFLLYCIKTDLQTEGYSIADQHNAETVGIFPSEGITVNERSCSLIIAPNRLICADPESEVELSSDNQLNVGFVFPEL